MTTFLKNLFLLQALALLAFACKSESKPIISHIDVPTNLNSSESSLHKAKDGTIYLSWIETDSLKNSKLLMSKLNADNAWSETTTIAQGDNWFVNWADFPSITSFGAQSLVTHYLEKSASGTYTYDVKLSISNNKGHSWQKAYTPHTDNTNSEHGFVSKVDMGNNSFLAVWLDGRQMAYAEKDSTITSEMTLRGAIFNDQGGMMEEYLLDDRVCECCQTDTAMTEEGPIVIYRNRSEDEIRDIYYTRQVNGEWTSPQAIYNDNWNINGCPVNGPAMTTQNNNVAIAWFSMSNGLPSVKVVFSNNNGETFSQPITIGDTYPMGRVDIEMLGDGSVLVSWLDTVDDKTLIQLQHVTSTGELSDVITLTESSESRSSGFPRMVIKDSNAIVSWTEVGDNKSLNIKTASINTDLMY